MYLNFSNFGVGVSDVFSKTDTLDVFKQEGITNTYNAAKGKTDTLDVFKF